MYLYIISWVITLSNRIPFINRIVTLLAAYYGRTTIWKILLKLRKIFIVFNSLIGMYMVYKTTGLGFDTFWANFIAIGNTYLEIFININKKLFNWLLDLFDYKVVPTDKPTSPRPRFYNPSNFNNPTNPSSKKWIDELYRPHNITINTNPWYKDLTTWLWIGGTFGTIALFYLGYKFVTDPTFIDSFFTKPFYGDTTPTQPNNNQPPLLEILSTSISSIKHKMNPLNWFQSNNLNMNDFLKGQQDPMTSDNRFYPFTNIKPHQPIYNRLKLLIFGESIDELQQRLHDRDIAWREMIPISLEDNRNIISGISTPGNIGIGVRNISGSVLLEQIEASTSFNILSKRIDNIPSTPKSEIPFSPSWINSKMEEVWND